MKKIISFILILALTLTSLLGNTGVTTDYTDVRPQCDAPEDEYTQ